MFILVLTWKNNHYFLSKGFQVLSVENNLVWKWAWPDVRTYERTDVHYMKRAEPILDCYLPFEPWTRENTNERVFDYP